jgi:DNA-binding transcriptional MerR regulator
MLTVSQVARKAKVSPNTVRNHVRDFPDLFSEAARGLKGNRLFNDDDVEALCSLVALKDSGMPLAEAAMRLRSQEAPSVIDIDATPLQHTANAPQTPQMAPDALQAILLSHNSLQRQIDDLRRAQRRDLWTHGMAFYLGMVTMGSIFYLVWLLTDWWWGG